jgi:hypothetical protein
MAAFDYTTAAAAFGYGGSAGASVDPVDEQTVMAEAVTAVSRGIDRHCHQDFSVETYTLRRLRGKVDQDGILTCYPPAPTISAVTAIEYRVGGATVWIAGDATNADAEEHIHGATVRLLGLNLINLRSARIDVRLSYTGGYADRDALPDDLAWAARAAAWYEFQRRSAPLDKTAMPSMGIVVIPGDWPKHITERLQRYVKVTPA